MMLLFWVDRGNSSEHTFLGKLLTKKRRCCGLQPIKAYLNDTLLDIALTTGVDGSFTFTRNFNPADQKNSYRLQVAFEGTGSQTAMLNSTDFVGNTYTLCQTVQFNFKPSANMTMITVEPQATDVTVPTKTPEQLQQEAENNGWLKPPEPRFSWFYPWFRLHFVMVYSSADVLHVGLSPLGGDIVTPYPPFDSWIADAINEVIIEPIAKAYLVGWMAAEITTYAGMYFGPTGFAIALMASIGLKEGLFMLATSTPEGLKGAFVGALFSWAYGFISTLKQIADLGIALLSDFFKIAELDFWKLLYKIVYIPISVIYLIRIILGLVDLGVW